MTCDPFIIFNREASGDLQSENDVYNDQRLAEVKTVSISVYMKIGPEDKRLVHISKPKVKLTLAPVVLA